jgi:hypothetical protein
MNSRVSFRWRAVNGVTWEVFLDTDQNTGTGYRGAGLSIGADYMVQATSTGTAQLYKYTGNGTNSKWRLMSTNLKSFFLILGSTW